MAITLTKKVTSTYANGWPEYGSPGSISATVQPYIAEMVTLEKTDGVFYQDNSTTSYRLWTDLESAQAFAELCVSATSQIGLTDYSYVITDI